MHTKTPAEAAFDKVQELEELPVRGIERPCIDWRHNAMVQAAKALRDEVNSRLPKKETRTINHKKQKR